MQKGQKKFFTLSADLIGDAHVLKFAFLHGVFKLMYRRLPKIYILGIPRKSHCFKNISPVFKFISWWHLMKDQIVFPGIVDLVAGFEISNYFYGCLALKHTAKSTDDCQINSFCISCF